MKNKVDSGVMTVYLTGKIDSSNSEAIDREIAGVLSSAEHNDLVIDMEGLDYISSAGLRVMLKLRKKYPKLRIINVSPDVYEIFDVTGFTQMMKVQRAYRVFDITGCEVVGEGANGKVYRLAQDTIVKVYRRAESLDDIKRETELARTAFVLGIPTAIPYDVVKVGDTYGSVFELLNAKSFAELLREDTANLEMIAKNSVEIAKIIHSTPAPENLPMEKETVLRWIDAIRDYLTKEQYEKFVSLVESLTEKGTMIHGDLHIKNIMQQNDETLLIDMDTLCIGHPIYELAFMFNAYEGFGVVDKGVIERFLGISAETAYRLWRRTLELYLETEDKDRLDEVEEKAALIGYLRVMRRRIRLGNDDEESKALIQACNEKIVALLEKVDTLEF